MKPTKILFVGNSGSGKTILRRALLEMFNDETRKETEDIFKGIVINNPTIGVHFSHFSTASDRRYILFDFSGKASHSTNKHFFFPEADVAFIIEGGENSLSPEQWEQEIRFSNQTIPIHRVSGSLLSKFNKICDFFDDSDWVVLSQEEI
nr:hypothetical protein pmam_205 [Pithovirus mammoth]